MESKQGFLITADLHLRDTRPTCRTDDFDKAQWDKMDYIAEVIRTKDLYWLDCGDLFHNAKPSYSLLSHLLYWFKTRRVHIDAAIVGNHDLPAHNLHQLDNSGWGVILQAGYIKRWLHDGIFETFLIKDDYHMDIIGVNYSENLDDFKWPNDTNDAALLYHDMVFKSEKSRIADIPGLTAVQLYGKVPFYTIFSGHNHQSFDWDPNKGVQVDYYCKKGVFNVGSMTRQSADQMEHIPSVMLWDGRGRPQRLPIPHKPADRCMDRGHL